MYRFKPVLSTIISPNTRTKTIFCKIFLYESQDLDLFSRAPTAGSVGKNIPTVGTNSYTFFVNNATQTV